MRRPVGRRSLGRATAGPGAKAGVRAGSRTAQPTTSPADRHRASAAPAPSTHPLTEAQILVGAASWLTSLRDWLAEEIDLADGETVVLPRTVAERVRDGLTRCAGLLDTLTVDPAQLPPLNDAPAPDAPTPATLSTRRLQ